MVAKLYAGLNADFTTMAMTPNGVNVNDQVGLTHSEQLQKFKVAEGAQIGIAFDGDGDRCITVDETGNVVNGDKIMYICGNRHE